MADPDNNQDGVNSSAARTDDPPQGAAGKKELQLKDFQHSFYCKIICIYKQLYQLSSEEKLFKLENNAGRFVSERDPYI